MVLFLSHGIQVRRATTGKTADRARNEKLATRKKSHIVRKNKTKQKLC